MARRRPPAITPSHLARIDPLLRHTLRFGRWLETAVGRQHLAGLSKQHRERLLAVVDPKHLLQWAAMRMGVIPARVPRRAAWRSGSAPTLYTIDAVAHLRHCSRKTIYNLLAFYREQFPARYQRGRNHPRRLRVLTEAEVLRLTELRGTLRLPSRGFRFPRP